MGSRVGIPPALRPINDKAWGFERLKLIAGDVAATTREYARSQLGARIALLYLDLDNYEGTLACLRNLYSLVSPGAEDRAAQLSMGKDADGVLRQGDCIEKRSSGLLCDVPDLPSDSVRLAQARAARAFLAPLASR